MPIIDMQRRISEAGRIRIGQQVATGNGKTRPAKLDTFRLTSPNKIRIEAAARLYGGTPSQWEAPAGQQWEIITQTDTLNVIVPPSDMAFSQHYELWSGGGCQRRCDGQNETISDGPCLCDPDKRECAIHTRLSVMLRDLPGLGVWRIDTSGYYAAVELQGAVEVMQYAAARGQMLPAQLRLEQRVVKRGGQTRRFAVPVLDVEISPAQLLGGHTPQLSDPGVVAIEPPRPVETNGYPEGMTPAFSAPLTPVPESVPEHPVAPIAVQATAVRTRRKSTQLPVPATGLKPRTVAQAGAAPQPLPPEDPEAEPLISAAQLKKLSIQLREAGFEEREARHDFVASAIGRPVGSAKELTRDEASKVIDLLENDQPTLDTES